MTPALAALPAPSLWWIDAAAGIFLAVSLVFGAFNGLSGEAARLVAFAVGLVVASLVFSAIRAAFFPEDGADIVEEPQLVLEVTQTSPAKEDGYEEDDEVAFHWTLTNIGDVNCVLESIYAFTPDDLGETFQHAEERQSRVLFSEHL